LIGRKQKQGRKGEERIGLSYKPKRNPISHSPFPRFQYLYGVWVGRRRKEKKKREEEIEEERRGEKRREKREWEKSGENKRKEERKYDLLT